MRVIRAKELETSTIPENSVVRANEFSQKMRMFLTILP